MVEGEMSRIEGVARFFVGGIGCQIVLLRG